MNAAHEMMMQWWFWIKRASTHAQLVGYVACTRGNKQISISISIWTWIGFVLTAAIGQSNDPAMVGHSTSS